MKYLEDSFMNNSVNSTKMKVKWDNVFIQPHFRDKDLPKALAMPVRTVFFCRWEILLRCLGRTKITRRNPHSVCMSSFNVIKYVYNKIAVKIYSHSHELQTSTP